MAPPHCINCFTKGLTDVSHRCDTEECPLLAQRTKESNNYIINLLIGVDLIKTWEEILFTDAKIVKEINANNTPIFSTKDKAVTDRQFKMETKLSTFSNDMIQLKLKVADIDSIQVAFASELAFVTNKVAEIKTAQTNNHNENVKMHGATNELLAKLTTLITAPLATNKPIQKITKKTPNINLLSNNQPLTKTKKL